MNPMKSLKGAAVILALLSAGAANAALLKFTLTGDYKAQWTLDSTLTADGGVDGNYFALYDVKGKFPGSDRNLADLYFYNADQLGGLEIYDYYQDLDLLMTVGDQLYTGSEEGTITFKLGTFTLTDLGGAGRYTLTVANDVPIGPAPNPVPEPASAAILLGGLGLMAGLRKRRLK
jgi:hypothetical protein